MTVSRIRKTMCTLAVTSLCAAPVFAQDMQEPQPVHPEPTREPVQEAEDYQGDYRGKDTLRGNRTDSTQPSTQPPRSPQSAKPQDDATAQGARSASAVGEEAVPRSQAASRRGAREMRADSVRLSRLDEAQVKDLQQELKDKGFYDGAIDGLPGPATRGALRQFHRSQANLASSGRLSSEGAVALGLDESEIERVKGEQEPDRQSAEGRQPRSGSAETRGSGKHAQPRGDHTHGTAGGQAMDAQPMKDDKAAGARGDAPETAGSPNDATEMH